MQEAKEISELKDAARRMAQFFAGKGVDVPHAMALEALSTSLGERNWRTVRGLLSREAGQEATVQPCVDKTWNPEDRFLVEGTHIESRLTYTRPFSASNALDAAYRAVAYEWSLFGEPGQLTVRAVVDRATGKHYGIPLLSSNSFMTHAQAFKKVIQQAGAFFKESLTRGKRAPVWMLPDGTAWNDEERQRDIAVLELFERLLASSRCQEELDSLLTSTFGTRGDLEGIMSFKDSTGKVWRDSMDDFLDKLFALLEKCSSSFMGRISDAWYQVRALRAVCPDDVSIVFALELEYRM